MNGIEKITARITAEANEAAAAVIAAEPMPASLENTPRATPQRIDCIMPETIVPSTPPVTAAGLNAHLTIRTMADGRLPMLPMMTMTPKIR